MAHSVSLEQPWRGKMKLVKMASMAITECLANIFPPNFAKIPLLLCVAERERQGRIDGLDGTLIDAIQRDLDAEFSELSLTIPHGRVSAGIALMHARDLLSSNDVPCVLIAATDSLLTSSTLLAFGREQRLLTPLNSNGFVPGEGAAAILIGPAEPNTQLVFCGLGFADEPARIDSEFPLLGKGLAQSIEAALAEAQCRMEDIDFRITDLSGEHYYFKEAALALSRTLRVRKEFIDIWHPAECIGEAGALIGVAALVVANAACKKGYAPGRTVLCHASGDCGRRTASIFRGVLA